MAIVFEANYSKKLGLPGYSSHQYSVTIRTELTGVDQIQTESNRIYRLLQETVDRDIRNSGFLPNGNNGGNGKGNGNHGGNGHAPNTPSPSQAEQAGGNGEQPAQPCTEKQSGWIIKLAETHMNRQEINQLILDRFGKHEVDGLTKTEASSLIEELIARFGGNGNGRHRGNPGNNRFHAAASRQ